MVILLFYPGEGPFGRFRALSKQTGKVVSHNFRTINYSFTTPTFGDSYFLAGMQTFEGTDTASLRYGKLTDSSVQIRVEEEKSADKETNHPNESVGYLLLRQAAFDEDKITAFDGAEFDFFGTSVAIDGYTMVVGSPNDDDKGADAGAAYIYERDVNKWRFVKKITALDGAAGDKFGTSVAISGDTVVVGAPKRDYDGTDTGLAYIFERNKDGSNKWGLVKRRSTSDVASGQHFGHSVAISGDTIVVGAYGDDNNGNYSGAAYVFDRNKFGSNFWGEVKKLLASDRAAGNYFGISVAISGDTVVVGARDADGKKH